MRRYDQHQAFTMIELVFVIIILGIVASIGSSVIAQTYESYLLERATYRAGLKTELAAQQIANLLSYRIAGTTIARNPNNLSDNVFVTDPLVATDNTHTTLEWIGTDNDGFSATILPPWNGFCDVTASDQTKIITPGSNLSMANTIFQNLSNHQVSFTDAQHPAIFFRDYSNRYSYDSGTGATTYYQAITTGTKPQCLGMVSPDRSCISSVTYTPGSNEKLDFSYQGSTTKKLISEQYKLAWTAYAIRQIPKAGSKLFDLELYYNYQPWEGERLNNGWNLLPHATLVTNVSVFKFAELGNTFRFKLCTQERIGIDTNISICKEKAIIL